MKKRKNKGFTLIELVVVIAVLAILAGVAIPRFMNLSQQALLSAEKADVGAIRTGIITMAAAGTSGLIAADATAQPTTLTYPDSLEGELVIDKDTGAATIKADDPDALFERVLELSAARDMKERKWSSAGGKKYKSPAGNFWDYNSTDGTFTKGSAPQG